MCVCVFLCVLEQRESLATNVAKTFFTTQNDTAGCGLCGHLLDYVRRLV